MNYLDAPKPTVEAKFHVEPHPDPVVQKLIELVEQLRHENTELRTQLLMLQSVGTQRPSGNTPWP